MEGKKNCPDGSLGTIKINTKTTESKRKEEKALLACMIKIYCKGNRHKAPLCPGCQALLSYAYQRIDKCPFMETKSFCSSCTVHCYQAEMREQIRRVMKYAGPRMLFVHPVPAVKHMVNTITATLKKKKGNKKRMKYNPVKLLFIIAAFLSLGIGIVGIVLPVLPTAPFFLLASFCFAKGSKRFHTWFCSTNLYKNHLDSFVKSHSMTLKTKIRILIPASAMLLLAFYFTPVFWGRIVIVCVFLFKYYYFIFRIRTIKTEEGELANIYNREGDKEG